MIKEIKAKSILSSRTKPDPWFGCKYNMNLYRGCQHQCIYCDSRSECYQIENFADILVKVNAIDLLKDELPRKRKKGSICFGAMNDAYMPIEKKYKLTRQALEVISKYRFPIHLMTKSNLVLRDLELIKKISDVYAAISFTITTADDNLAKKIEPRAPLPSKRFKAMKELSKVGIYTGVCMMPILPFIEDNQENIIEIVENTARSGGSYIIPAIGMTLRDRQREYYYKNLDILFPGLSTRYKKRFGNNYQASARNVKELEEVLTNECKKSNIQVGMETYKEQESKQLDMF